MGLSDPRDKKFKKLIESRKLHKKKDYLILDTADIHACSTTTILLGVIWTIAS